MWISVQEERNHSSSFNFFCCQHSLCIKFPFPTNTKQTNEEKLGALPYTNEVILCKPDVLLDSYALAYKPVFKDSKRLAESKLDTDAANTG